MACSVIALALSACTATGTRPSNTPVAAVPGFPNSPGSPGSAPALGSATEAPASTTEPASKTIRFPVGIRTLTFADRSRTVSAAHTTTGRPGPRILRTFVWYPAITGSSKRPATSAGPFPLVVFASGFDALPMQYEQLLQSWARAGFVVAAPVFPLTNPRTIGGADESDIANQPQDVSFVLTQLLRSSRSGGTLSSLIDPSRIAIAGQSDGAETALADAYGNCCLDRRFDAAIIMAGQVLPFEGNLFKGKVPPILVVQGSTDTVNPPAYSRQIFRAASAPKYLLWLNGADHIQPFMQAGKYESIVSSVGVGFLDKYLGKNPGAAVKLPAGTGGAASLRSVPK